MADIFVSYSRADRARVAPLVAALEAQGWSVWWDPAITGGQEFDTLITSELETARAAIVVWTADSVRSRWVRGEARMAADRHILVPVQFGAPNLPLDARVLHTIDLDGWGEDAHGAPFQELLRALNTLLAPSDDKAGTPLPSAPGSAPKVRMTSIVSLDIARYSARTEADGAAAARQVVALRARLGAIAARHGGRIFNTAGDGIMLEFAAAKESLAAICEILDDRPLSEPEARIGAHLGDVTVTSGGDLLGHGVNVAARLMALAKPGSALISGELKGAVGHLDRPLRPLGEVALAKMDVRIHAFEIAPISAAAFVPPPRKPKLKPWQIGAAAGAILIAIAGVLFMAQHASRGGAETRSKVERSSGTATSTLTSAVSAPPRESIGQAQQAPAKPRIAILPFENLSPDPNNAFFADGLHEEILTALANASPDLDVISRTTMDSYKGKPVTVEQLVKDLGCTDVLEGSVRRQGNEVRLTLQLIDAKDDSHIWAQDYDRTLTNALTLQSEVAATVASQLSVKLQGSSQASGPTADPLAYDAYLKARIALQNLSGFSSADDMRKAIHLYDQALKLDPTMLRAYADRVYIRMTFFELGMDTSGANLDAAKEDVATMRRLAPDDAQTLFAEGSIAQAEVDYAHALQLYDAAQAKGFTDPNLINAKADLLIYMGRFEEAEKLDRQLAALDPDNGTRQYYWWFGLMVLRRPQEAIDVANLSIARWAQDPGISGAYETLRNVTLFMYGGDTGALDKVIATDLAGPPTSGNLDSDFLYYRNRAAEARQRIDAVGVGTIISPANGDNMYWPVKRVSETPLAAQRGWLDLYLNDKAQAKKDGARVLDFLAQRPETQWSKWFFTMLRADAALFMGKDEDAVEYSDEGVELTKGTQDKADQNNAEMWRALILAWAGHTDEAAQLLEGYATSIPGLWPGEVVYNPGWYIPLKDNPRYQALRARLLAQMKATKLE